MENMSLQERIHIKWMIVQNMTNVSSRHLWKMDVYLRLQKTNRTYVLLWIDAIRRVQTLEEKSMGETKRSARITERVRRIINGFQFPYPLYGDKTEG